MVIRCLGPARDFLHQGFQRSTRICELDGIDFHAGRLDVGRQRPQAVIHVVAAVTAIPEYGFVSVAVASEILTVGQQDDGLLTRAVRIRVRFRVRSFRFHDTPGPAKTLGDIRRTCRRREFIDRGNCAGFGALECGNTMAETGRAFRAVRGHRAHTGRDRFRIGADPFPGVPVATRTGESTKHDISVVIVNRVIEKA